MRDGQKGTRGILIFCIAAMGLHLMGQGFSALRENGWEKGKALAAAACLQAGEQAMALYLPGDGLRRTPGNPAPGDSGIRPRPAAVFFFRAKSGAEGECGRRRHHDSGHDPGE